MKDSTPKFGGKDEALSEDILRWARLEGMQRVAMIERLRDRWRKSVVDAYQGNPDKIEDYFSQGDEAFQQLSKILKVLNIPSPSPETVREKIFAEAHQFFIQKDFNRAFDIYHSLRESNAKFTVDQYVEYGMSAFYLERFDDADRISTDLLAQNHENVKALLLKGLTLYGQKKFKESKKVFQRAKALRPDSITIVKYLKAADDQISSESSRSTSYAKSKPEVQVSENENPAAKRRWVRRPCNFEMVINDFDQMTALAGRVRSLSAGGCLIDGLPVPDFFSFVLDLGNGKFIQGTGKKVYTNRNQQVGIAFDALNPTDQDIIQRKLMV